MSQRAIGKRENRGEKQRAERKGKVYSPRRWRVSVVVARAHGWLWVWELLACALHGMAGLPGLIMNSFRLVDEDWMMRYGSINQH